MANELSVKVDLTHISGLDAFQRVGLFANLARSIEDLAQTGVSRWQEAVDAVPGLWVGERIRYKATIGARQTGPYAWEVYSNYRFAQDIESGRPPYDLKRMLDTSLKVRVSKAGRRYLIIPFRHNTPGNTAHAPAMPSAVHAEASELSKSRVTGQGKRLSGTGAMDVNTRKPATVRARKYVWGDRLGAGLMPKLKQEHKTDPAAGMVRFANSSGGSKYLTFRVMVEGSPGWIIPARPGLWIARNVAESLQRTADVDLPAAMSRDLSAA